MSNKEGRVRVFKHTDEDEKTEYSVYFEMEDGTTYKAKAFPNVGKGDKVYWAGNVYKDE